MGAGRRHKYGCVRRLVRLISSSLKVLSVAIIVVSLWKVTLLLTGFNRLSKPLRGQRAIKLRDASIPNHVDVTVGGAQVISNNLTLGLACISLFKEEKSRLASIIITTSIAIKSDKFVKVVKHNTNLSITTDNAILKLKTFTIEKMSCFNIIEHSKVDGYHPKHNIDVGAASFYGGAEMFHQQWPLNNGELVTMPFLPIDYKSGQSNMKGFGPVLERYWLTSDGVAVFVDHTTSLHVGYGQTSIRFKAVGADHNQTDDLITTLNYTVCLGSDVKTTHTNLLGKLWRFPKDVPDILTFTLPIWSTRVRYQRNVNKEDVLTFVKEIVSHNCSASQLVLNDMYTTNYGDYKWDTTKFPQVELMINDIHKNIPCLTTEITPFVNEDAEAYKVAENLGIFVKEKMKAAKFKWSQGDASHIDFTSYAASQFFLDSISSLKVSGVDSFVMDGGQISLLPHNFTTYKHLQNPVNLCTHLVNNLRVGTSNKLIVRCGYQTQYSDVFVHTLPKESTWDSDGLKSIIPSILQYSITGYIFFVPDVIGGNGFTADEGTIVSGRLPHRELFIRWCQLATFLPIMQFSITPWDYDDETLLISQKFIKLHEDYVTPKIIPIAREAVQTGYPIIRPLWWADPTDPQTFDIDSQFLIGDEVLVAPVLHKEATYRSVYLPRGQWKDMNYNKIFEGPQYIDKYFTPLDKIPYFERLK